MIDKLPSLVFSVLLVASCPLVSATEVILARVGETTLITRAAVDAQIEKITSTATLDPQVLARLRDETARVLVDRALVIARLDREQFALHEPDWDKRYSRYVESRVTVRQIETYYAEHLREFDGTRLRVSHILWRVPETAPIAQREAALKHADDVRRRIEAGELKFADAVKQYSSGPSRERGGDLGWITRRGPMVESFSRAAFQLKVGELSSSVQTGFGVHLIQCTAEEAGKLTWQEAREELLSAVGRELFGRLAQEEQRMTQVEWVGTVSR